MEPKTSAKLTRPRPCPPPPPRGVPIVGGGGGGSEVAADDAASGGCPQPPLLRRHEARATEAVRPWLGLWLAHPPAARPYPPISPWVVGVGVPGGVGER